MDLENQSWFRFLDPGMQDLVKLSRALLDNYSFRSRGGPASPARLPDGILGGETAPSIHDFSFVVFPIAKAYEGFLKKWFFQNDLIDEKAYHSNHFRIGKALNPSLPKKFRNHQYVYDQLTTRCRDPRLGDQLWQAWKQGRNLVFHYFPNHQHFLTFDQAKDKINQLTQAMSSAFACKVTPATASRRGSV